MAAITFGIVFLAEVADTSGLATMVLGTRFPARWVLVGVFAGMLVHVVVAVAAGTLVALLPERPLAAIVAVIFFLGAFLLLREDDDDDDAEQRRAPTTRWGVITTAFLVTALSEFADPSQIIIATLAARYDAPVAVGIGALLGLWAVSAVAVLVGNRLRRVVPVVWVTRIAAAILVVLGVLSAIEAVRG